MASNAGATHEDYDDAARLWLLGLMAGQELDSIMEQLTALHSHNNTFPAEVLLELAAEAIEESEASPAEPIQYEGMCDRLLPEYHFRGGYEPAPSDHADIYRPSQDRAGRNLLGQRIDNPRDQVRLDCLKAVRILVDIGGGNAFRWVH